jgi:hypothetical protein
MNLGIMLPLCTPFAQGEFERIRQVLHLGYTDLWLQDWPQGSGLPGRRDHGSGHDPLLYAAHLAREFGQAGAQVGFAVLRLDYRHPPVTARAVVSAQLFGGQPLRLGLGTETATQEDVKRAAQDWLAIRSHLHADRQADVFLLPPDYEPPRMYLASGKSELWEEIGYQAEGWLTTRFDPRQARPIVEEIRRHVPDLEVVLQLFWQIDLEDADAFCPGARRSLIVGKNRVQQWATLWRELGVSRLIYFPPQTPDEEHLAIFADAVLGGAR